MIVFILVKRIENEGFCFLYLIKGAERMKPERETRT